nr:MAG TPA: hypothetical protein [Caudoviricetes sp.]
MSVTRHYHNLLLVSTLFYRLLFVFSCLMCYSLLKR